MSKRGDSLTSSIRTFQTSPTKDEPKKPRRQVKLPKVKAGRPLPWLLVLVLLVFSIFMFVQYRDARQKLQTSDVAKTNQQMLAKLSKFIDLPNTTPTFATVNNVSVLKRQSSFFDNAQSGDKLIVYPSQNKTILYRPSTNTIINFSTSLKITTNASK